MALIDRTGRFRGRPTQGIIDETKNGFPQFIVRLEATEYFDETTGEWIDWSQYGQSITAYLVLFNATKALMNYDQVMKAFQWDGTDMAALQTNDFGDLQISFEVEENVYNGNVSLRVNWVDTYDASGKTGGGDLTPSDQGKVNTLNAKFRQFMKTAPAPAPAKAPVKNITPPVPSRPANKQTLDAASAWLLVNESVSTGSDPTDAWLNAIEGVEASDGVAVADFTSDQWNNVVEITLGVING